MSTAPTNEPQRRETSNNPVRLSTDSPRSGATAAPVSNSLASFTRIPSRQSSASGLPVEDISSFPSSSSPSSSLARHSSASDQPSHNLVRRRSHSNDDFDTVGHSARSPQTRGRSRVSLTDVSMEMAKAKSRSAQKKNDSLVYLDGPQVYTCAQCRTHLTSHDEIISKSFHGRHGRAYLFDQCVNVTLDPCENRRLITGLHSVSDIRCKRCRLVVGWTYLRAYDSSQKYKEGKYIIEKINLHLEESDCYSVGPPAGERPDRFRLRSMSWGSEASGLSAPQSPRIDVIYEYRPRSASMSTAPLPIRPRSASMSTAPLPFSEGTRLGSSALQRRSSDTFFGGPAMPPL